MKDGQRPPPNGFRRSPGARRDDGGSWATPIEAGSPRPVPENVAFFREYAGMTDEEKDRYREALKIMFPGQEPRRSED